MANSIKPETAAGIKDYLPEEMIPRQQMMDKIRKTMELFGFVPLGTPVLEREEVLTGGDPDFSKQIFRIKSSEGLALRFDLTVPLARVVAGNPVSRPFKRYQVGPVFRGESPQFGRYREFFQFDADTVGSDSPMSDAEIIAVMYSTLKALEVPKFTVRVNSRKILNGLAAYAGFRNSMSADVLRVIDKLDKIGWDGVAGELEEKGLERPQIEAVKKFIDLRASSPRETLRAVGELMSNSPIAQEGVANLMAIADFVDALGVPADYWTIDLSIARGLSYYTGAVFETTLDEMSSIGSVFSGGRYDDLVDRFGAGIVPAVGASVGVDRLFAALEKLGLLKKQQATAEALVLNFDKSCEVAVNKATASLRQAGIRTEIYFGKENTLKAQLSYAVSREYRLVVIIGPRELATGTAQIRDLSNRTQKETPLGSVGQLASEIIK